MANVCPSQRLFFALLVTLKPSLPQLQLAFKRARPRFCSPDKRHLLICDAKAQYFLARCYPIR